MRSLRFAIPACALGMFLACVAAPTQAQTAGPCRAAIDAKLKSKYGLGIDQMVVEKWANVEPGRYMSSEFHEVQFVAEPIGCAGGDVVMTLNKERCSVNLAYVTGECDRLQARVAGDAAAK